MLLLLSVYLYVYLIIMDHIHIFVSKVHYYFIHSMELQSD